MGRWLEIAGLAALLALGVACQLGITDPLWLQHLRLSPSEIGENSAFALAGLVAHAALVGFLAFRRRNAIHGLLPRDSRLRTWHVVFAAVLFVACAAHLTRYVDRTKTQFAAVSYAAQLGVTALFFVLDFANLLLILAAAPFDAVRAIRESFARLNWDRVLPWILAAWTVAASLLLGWVALDQVPHIPDELCYIFQAECLARGIFWDPPRRTRTRSRST